MTRSLSLFIKVCGIVTLVTMSGSAKAYVGPGVGVGVIGAVLGILWSVAALVFGSVYYPIKRFIKKLRKRDK